MIIRGQNFLILRPLSGQIEINQLHHREKTREGENRNLLLHAALHPIIKIIAVQRHHIERTGHGRTQQIASSMCLYSGKEHAVLILPEIGQLLSSCSVQKRFEQRRMTPHRIELIRPALQSVFLRPAVTYQTGRGIKPDKVIDFLLRVISPLCHLYTPLRQNPRMRFCRMRQPVRQHRCCSLKVLHQQNFQTYTPCRVFCGIHGKSPKGLNINCTVSGNRYNGAK